MSSEIEKRVERLERKLQVTRALAGLFLGGLAIALVVRTSEPSARSSLRVSDGGSQLRLHPNEIKLGPTTLDQRGLWARAYTNARALGNVQNVSAVLEATPDTARSYIAIGGIGFDESLDVGSNVVRLRAYGRVHSEIQIDTETGAWTLVRSFGDPAKNPTETTQLIGPLSTE